MSERVDVCVVGGGIVGLATACAIATRRPDLRLCVLEKEDTWGRHQTGHNSGVIHSGLYYAPGSLKATLTRQGLQRMYEFCERHDVPVERCGKVVVATREDELPRLAALEERGRANGVTVSRLDAAGIRAHEPHARGIAGLYVADTGVTDFALVTARLADLLRTAHADLRTGTTVTAIHPDDGQTRVGTDLETIRARRVVVAAGLHSDDLVRRSGATPLASIVPFRGEYYQLDPSRSGLVRSLVYPVPDPGFPFLGVHLTRGVDGSVHVGPNAVPGLDREGYRRRDVSRTTVRELARNPGLRPLARRYWRTGSAEVARSLVKPLFVHAVRRLVPAVRGRDLVRAEAGVRAQALLADGMLVDDFLFQQVGSCLHVLNAPSPAATASFAIGEYIADRALAGLD